MIHPQGTRAAIAKQLPVAGLAAAGYGLTVLAFYPGYLTRDAFYVYENVKEFSFGDWQGPMMGLIWRLVDPLAPGTGSIFLLTSGLYWLAFGLLGITLAHRSFRLGVAAVILAFAPPGLFFLAMIWRDVLFAVVWLTAAAIAYAGSNCGRGQRLNAQSWALLLVALGILLRPNAIIAVPILIAYALWPARFDWKRAALLFMPAVAAGYGLVHVVYYEIINVTREYPERSVMVFDLGGVTHFSGLNMFPGTWTPEEAALLTSKCYDPERWDVYWTIQPCGFVMERLDAEGLFKGSPELPRAWLRAITTHPLAYLRHRATFMWRFLAGDNLTLAEHRLEDTHNAPLMNDPTFKMMLTWHAAIKSSILFRAWFWLVLSMLVLALAWRMRATSSGAFAVAVTGSAIIYVLAFALVGVAAEFRYVYWCVLATLAAAPAAMAERWDAVSGPAALSPAARFP
jgi:hypothetical protein